MNADDIGPHTVKAVKAIIASKKVEEQSYKTCIALLKLADTYSVVRLEGACEKALSYGSTPSFRSIRTILKTGSDRTKKERPPAGPENDTAFAFVRGKAYYAEPAIGGEHHGE